MKNYLTLPMYLLVFGLIVSPVYGVEQLVYDAQGEPGVTIVHGSNQNPYIPLADLISAKLYIDGSKVTAEVELEGTAPSQSQIMEWTEGESTWDVTIEVLLSGEDGNYYRVMIQVGTSTYKYNNEVAIASARAERDGGGSWVNGTAVYEPMGDRFRIECTFPNIRFAPPFEDGQRLDVSTSVFIYDGKNTGGGQDSLSTKKALITSGMPGPNQPPEERPPSSEEPEETVGEQPSSNNYLVYAVVGVVIVMAGLLAFLKLSGRI